MSRALASHIAIWIVLLAVAVGAQNTPRHVQITMTDGRVFKGRVQSETEEQVILLIEGIRTPFNRDQIAQLRDIMTIEEQYRQRRASLADEDRDGRYELTKWLYGQKAFYLAQRELTDLDRRYSDDKDITLLSRAVAEQLKIQASSQDKQEPKPKKSVQTKPQEKDKVNERQPSQKLNQEQINQIRVYELPVDLPSVRPMYVSVAKEAIDKLLTDYATHEWVPKGRDQQQRLRRAPGWQQAELLFQVQARSLYSDITVRTDPPAMAIFRRQVHHQYVLNYCATNRCHGGTEAQDLILFRDQPNQDETVYTNFYILHRYNKGITRMIERAEPTQSLLLQYGLAKEVATTPHPKVTGWRPHFRSDADPRFKLFVNWIHSLWRTPPDYGITYDIPKADLEPEEQTNNTTPQPKPG